VEDGGARYPVVVDPWIQQAELTPSDGGDYDHFGWSVAISGSTIVVGAVCHPGTSTDCAAGIQVVPEPLMCSPKAAERGVSNRN